MKVFVTGASGFIGSAVVKDLLAAGHEVLGLARSEESAKAIINAGAQVLKGSLDDLEVLKQGVLQTNGVIHTAFVHDFSQFANSAEKDKLAIEAMGEVLKGTSKPIVVTGGTLGLPTTNGWVTEADASPNNSPRFSESAAIALAEAGINASVVRLSPMVHGIYENGFSAGFGLMLIEMAKQNGVAAYVGDGTNRWTAVHRLDAARLFRLAFEKAAKGARYNAVGNDDLISMRKLAEFIGEKLNLPVKSITQEEAMKHFGWMTNFITFDSPATGHQTQEQLGWKPTHIGLIEDMQQHYF